MRDVGVLLWMAGVERSEPIGNKLSGSPADAPAHLLPSKPRCETRPKRGCPWPSAAARFGLVNAPLDVNRDSTAVTWPAKRVFNMVLSAEEEGSLGSGRLPTPKTAAARCGLGCAPADSNAECSAVFSVPFLL